jgi:hypothetical protein
MTATDLPVTRDPMNVLGGPTGIAAVDDPPAGDGHPDPAPGTRRRRRRSIAERVASFLERRVDRRGVLRKGAMAGTALAVAPATWALRPGSAYAAVCARNALCNDGYTEFCCTITGANRCPPGTALGGWWKVDGSHFCGGGPRYYMDCNAMCGGCGCGANGICPGSCSGTPCGCANGDCNNRKAGCTGFRYGQCNQGIRCLGPIVCRVVTCSEPWRIDGTCTTAARTDNATRYHSRPCLEVDAIGAVDSCTVVPGGVRVTGWAIDPSAVGAPVSVNVYDCLRPQATVLANIWREDVHFAFPGQGPFHGFDVFYRLCPGDRLVSVSANDTSGRGANWIFHQMVPIDPNPSGHFDRAEGGVGSIRASGFVIGADGGQLPVDIYEDGRRITRVMANLSRPDLGAAYPHLHGHYGFDIAWPAGPGNHNVCVIARSPGGDRDVDLGCRPVTVAADPTGAVESVTSPGSGSLRVVGWARDVDTSAPIQVRVTVDGVDRGTHPANRSRGDRWNGYGFDVTLTGVSPGVRDVCVTALSVGRGRDVSLGCTSTGVAAVAAGQVMALEADGDGVRVATTAVERTDGAPANVRVLVDGQFRASLRAGDGGIDEVLALPPGDHEVVVTATVDGPRTIPVVLASARVEVTGVADAPGGTEEAG